MTTQLKTRLATVYVWTGDKPIPAGTQITYAMLDQFSKQKQPTVVGRKMLGKSHGTRVKSGGGLWAAKDILPGVAVTAEHVTKRKPLVPKYAVGDTVIMQRTVVLNINGSSVSLIRYVLGVYYGPRDAKPIHAFDRSESCIQQKVSGNPW